MDVEWDFTCAKNVKVRLSASAKFIVQIGGGVMTQYRSFSPRSP